MERFDAVVIGGGFYGVNIALELKTKYKLPRVLLVERSDSLLSRASGNNQARVHSGYHYPRSLSTAYRSQVNSNIFGRLWPSSVSDEVTAVYAISQIGSKVSSRQFEEFANRIGSHPRKAPKSITQLFDSRTVEQVYSVEEKVFNWVILRDWARDTLEWQKVEQIFSAHATEVLRLKDGNLGLAIQPSSGNAYQVVSPKVFNCTYSAINQLKVEGSHLSHSLKHELTEIALVDAPSALSSLAITIMDGPFFSLLPYPSHPGYHTLSHVLYTPLAQLSESTNLALSGIDIKSGMQGLSTFDLMRRDASRFVPSIAEARFKNSIFEIKTVLSENEVDDGRPILFHEDKNMRGLFTVMGGKIDNVRDALEHLGKMMERP